MEPEQNRHLSFYKKMLERAGFSSVHKDGASLLKPVFELAEILRHAEIIDEVCEILPVPQEPFFFGYSTSGAKGIDFFSRKQALWATVAEALERSIWRTQTDYFINPQTFNLREANDKNILHPDVLAGFTAEQRLNLPNLQYNIRSSFKWIEGWCLTSQQKILMPAQLVSKAWFKTAVQGSGSEPYLRAAITTGLATHHTREEAIVRALLEVIERDAFMISYLNELSLPRVDLDVLSQNSTEVKDVLASFKKSILEVHAVLLLSDFDIPIVWAIIVDRTGQGPAVCVGAKASFSLEDAVLGSLKEAMLVRRGELVRKRAPLPPPSSFTRDNRIAWWAHPHQLENIGPFLSGPLVRPHADFDKRYVDQTNSKARLDYLVSACKDRGFTAAIVDMSSSSFNLSPLNIFFAVIPELQPLHLNEKFPAFGGARLSEVPRSKGYLPRSHVLTIPHPFP